MLLTVLLLLLNAVTNASVIAKCSNNTEPHLTFTSTNDVDGRYHMEWCTESDKDVTSWEVTLRYNENRPPEKCQKYDLLFRGAVHSHFNKIVNSDSLRQCSYACFSTNLDLIFNGTCYHIKTLLHRGHESSSPNDYVFFVQNAFPKEHFTNSRTPVYMQSNSEHLSVHWYLSYVPLTDYKMELCLYNNITGQLQNCKDVTDKCSVMGAHQNEVQCEMVAPYGSYLVQLKHLAPWDAGRLFDTIRNKEYRYEHRPELNGREVGSNGTVLWLSCGGLAMALVLALALVFVCRHLQRKRMLRGWKSQSSPKCNSVQRSLLRGRVLLLYARDCAPLMKLAAALRTLLRRTTDDKVYDLYAMETWTEIAGAPGEWVRRALSRSDVRVVLLQTPALEQLHRATGDLKPERPAAGRRTLYRVPHAADDLLSLCLRLLNETAHHTPSYLKYYKAVISGLEVDVAPSVTPLRCYRLPGDALTLVRDLDPTLFPADPMAPSGAASPPCLTAELRALEEASEELLSHVRENPAYLTEELLFI
ncbi:unnamed protein product [Leptosia nina]|uniref:SEFIR domain-containing protein n=1 Tax=Leptosia nina TaxID=320188 RepID=A0AAV1IV82_9NEOP